MQNMSGEELNLYERIIDFNYEQIEDIYSKYRQYLQENTNNIDILITLGNIEVKYYSNFSIAKEYFEKCIQLNCKEVDAYLGLCNIIIKIRCYKEYNKAFDYLEICMTLRKDYWRTYYIKSWLLFLSERDEEGTQVLEQGLLLKSDSIYLLSMKAIYLEFYFEDKIKAKELALQMVEQNKDNDPQIFYFAAFIYQKTDKAISYYQQCLKYNSKDLKAITDLAESYKYKGIQVEFQKYVESAKHLYPKNSYLLYSLGTYEKDEDKSLQLYQEALRYDEENRFAYYGIANIFKKQYKFKEQIDQYKKVLQFKPNDKKAKDNLLEAILDKACDEFNNNNFQYVIIYLKQCLEIDPKKPIIYNALAETFQQLFQYEKSIYYFKKYIELQPNDIPAYQCYQQSKQSI